MSALSILNEIENVVTEDFVIEEPALLRAGSGIQSKYYTLNRYAKNIIYNGIGLKSKLSSDLFGLDSNIWSSVIKSKYDESEFDFEDKIAIVFRGKIIELISKDAYDTASLETFISKLKANSTDSYYNSFDTLVITLKKDKAVMLLSLNFNGGWYSLHSGITENDKLVIFPRADIESSSLVEFMYQFNNSFESFMENTVNISNQDIKSLGFDFATTFSLREMYDIVFKDMKCGTTLDEDGYIASIPGISSENSEILVRFFNSFGLTFKSLKKLSYLRKTFRSSNITACQLLKILLTEMKSESISVNGYTFANICRLCDTEEFDKKIIEEELKK